MSDNMRVVVDVSNGTLTEVPLSAAEIAQREKDASDWEAMKAAQEAAAQAKEAARVSARARLAAQGWTDAEIDVTYPTLVAPA